MFNARMLLTILFFLMKCNICHGLRYDNFTLFETIPITVDHMRFLQNLEKQKYLDIKFWKRPFKLHHDVQLIINPTDRELFMERARHFGMHVNVLQTDLQKAFEEQTIRRYLPFRVDTYKWDSYHNLKDIYQWLADLVGKFPDESELITIGQSAEGKDIYCIAIKRRHAKYKVIVEGGIHGNEWIAIEFVTYLANELLHSDPKVNWYTHYISRRYNWFLIPIVNPDGFDFTQTGDRLWKKNKRSVNGGLGVNLDRNFAHSFGKYDASTNPKDENYAGPHAFSEPETAALSKFIAKNKANLRFYFSFHGYGQKIIIPYSDRVNHVEDFGEMDNYGKQAIIKMYRYSGIKYGIGTVFDTSGTKISGNSASWVKQSYKVKYVYTFHLRDNGRYGYALPSDKILETCKETMVGLSEIMVAKPRRIKSDLFADVATVATFNIGNLLFIFFIFVLK